MPKSFINSVEKAQKWRNIGKNRASYQHFEQSFEQLSGFLGYTQSIIFDLINLPTNEFSANFDVKI